MLRLQSDERLVALTRRGSTNAFEVLVSRYESRLLAFCRHLLSSREDAEDVLQEVLASAYNAMLADERAINVRPWLYRIARNRCLNHLRRAQAIGVDSMDVHLSEHGASTADKVHAREEFRSLVGDIHSLPESQRTALVLREMDALSYEQIAEAMETTVPSVKSLLVRARVSLAEASEARLLNCEEVRAELGEIAEGLVRKPNPLVRRHLKTCSRCAAFQSHLKDTNRALAALLPFGPVAGLYKLWLAHLGHSVGSGATAAGASAGGAAGAAGAGAAGAGAAGAVGAGAAAGSGAGGLVTAGVGALATKAAAGLAAAAIVTAGAVEVGHGGQSHPKTNPAISTAVNAGIAMASSSGVTIAQPISDVPATSARTAGMRPKKPSRASAAAARNADKAKVIHPALTATSTQAPGAPAPGRTDVTTVPTVLPPTPVPAPPATGTPTTAAPPSANAASATTTVTTTTGSGGTSTTPAAPTPTLTGTTTTTTPTSTDPTVTTPTSTSDTTTSTTPTSTSTDPSTPASTTPSTPSTSGNTGSDRTAG